MLNSQSGEFDPEEIARKIYPILAFRDRVVKAISSTIEKVHNPFPAISTIPPLPWFSLKSPSSFMTLKSLPTSLWISGSMEKGRFEYIIVSNLNLC